MKLTEREITGEIRGGFLHIVVPDNTAESGFRSYKMSADRTYINRGVLKDNNVHNALAYHIYNTDNNTENLPTGANPVGVLEAFGKDDLELRYTCFTNNEFEYWATKQSGNDWEEWQKMAINIGDIDHNKLLNYKKNEHIDWTNADENLKTSGHVESIVVRTFPSERSSVLILNLNKTFCLEWSGAIKITLPITAGAYSFVLLHIAVFDYRHCRPIEFIVHAYMYRDNWSGRSNAMLITNGASSINSSVSFALSHENKGVIYLGDVTDSHYYTSVTIRDITVFYNNYNINFWKSGIEIEMSQEMENVSIVRENIRVDAFSVKKDSEGNATIPGTFTASNFILASDITKKANIQPFNTNVDDIEILQFNYKDDKEKRTRYGVIAQEIEGKHPEFVYTDNKGIKSVAYIDLLLAKVAYLENKIKEQENK